jgi:DNA-binding transcriptional regulator LsrR (DeoR family)
MAQTDVERGGIKIATSVGSATNATITTLQPPVGQCVKLVWATCFAAGSTAANLQTTRSDGTTQLARVGGAGIGILSAPLVFSDSSDARLGCCGVDNDSVIANLFSTGSSATEIAVGYVFIPS